MGWIQQIDGEFTTDMPNTRQLRDAPDVNLSGPQFFLMLGVGKYDPS